MPVIMTGLMLPARIFGFSAFMAPTAFVLYLLIAFSSDLFETGQTQPEIKMHKPIKISQRIYIRVFKTEKCLELWEKAERDSIFQAVRLYSLTTRSLILGFKQDDKDGKLPEGLYYINQLGAGNNKMRIGFPNVADDIMLINAGIRTKLKAKVFICEDTSGKQGDILMSKEHVAELFKTCNNAFSGGDTHIPVHIFPFRMTTENVKAIKPFSDADALLWLMLEQAYSKFENSHTVPAFSFGRTGYYIR